MTENKTDLRGVEVIITDPDPDFTESNDQDLVIFIDTDHWDGRHIRIRINDALLYDGNPNATYGENIEHNPTDGYFITQKRSN